MLKSNKKKSLKRCHHNEIVESYYKENSKYNKVFNVILINRFKNKIYNHNLI